MNIFEIAKCFKQEEQEKIKELKRGKNNEEELILKARTIVEPILEEFKEAGYQITEDSRASKDIISYILDNEKNRFRLSAVKYHKQTIDESGEKWYLEKHHFCIEIFDKCKKTWYSKIDLCEFEEDLPNALAKYMTKYI